MPDLFDLDRAFEDLTHDVGARTRPPGAERASGAARRRRTTKLAVGALVVLVGAGTAAVQLRPHDSNIAPADELPAPAPLTVDVMDRVTADWVSGWTVPTDSQQLGGDLTSAGDACVNSLLKDTEGDTPARTGASIFLAGGSLAFARGAQATSVSAARTLFRAATPSATCGHVERSAPADDTDLITATASDAHGHAVFAVARWHDRIALLGISDPAARVPDGLPAAVGTALLAAVQDDAIVSTMPPVLQESMGGGSRSQSAHSSDATTYSMSGPTADDLQKAFAGWAAGYSTEAGSDMIDAPDCLQDTASSSTGESVGNRAMASLSTYGSAEEAGIGLSGLAKSLQGCGFRVEGSWTAGPVMATRGGAKPVTLWFVKDGRHVGSVQADGWSDPPAAVTGAVDDLLATAVGTAKADGTAHGEVSASAAG